MTTDLGVIEQIKQLKARYFRCMDQKDWDGYRSVFTEDVLIDTTDDTGPGTEIVGSDEYVNMLAPILKDAISVHHGHMNEIKIFSAVSAQGVWAMEDHIWFSKESGMGKLWGTGWYEETYRCEKGEWKIAAMRLRRQRVEIGGVQTYPPE